MAVSVSRVSGRRALNEFIRFPNQLYDPSSPYVAPLDFERRQFFSPKNPFFDHAEAVLFLARDGKGLPVGRLTAHIDRTYNDFHGSKTGFFGFFDSIDDPAVAEALFSSAEGFLSDRGMEMVLGPMNFTTNDEIGVLAEGFSTPPFIMMPYNAPYYTSLIEGCGYARQKDLFAYYAEYNGRTPEIIEKVAHRALRSVRVTVRHLEIKKLGDELALIKEVYNDAWEKNWGFVPLTDAEIEYLAKNFKPLLDPSLVLLAFRDENPVGFLWGLPDYNIALKPLRGKLFPFGFIRFLLAKRKINRVRVLTLGIRKGFRGMGLEAILLDEIFRRAPAKGYTAGELSWILEDNHLMNRLASRIALKPYRVYRIYGKPLCASS
jgi:GNAT superfamily N-acetyltransferase